VESPATSTQEPVRRPFLWLWSRWPAGACVAAMGLLAAYYAIFVTPPISGKEKAGWIAALFGLFFLELLVIVKERSRQNREYVAQLEGIEETRTAHLASIEELRAVSESRTAAMMRLLISANDPVNSVKARSLRLSEQILEFVFHRLEAQPQPDPSPLKGRVVPLSSLLGPMPVGFGPTYDPFERIPKETREILAYNAETIEIYKGRFVRSVRDVCDGMIQAGIKGAQHDWLYRARDVVPSTLVEMKAVAEGIGQIASGMQPQSAFSS
jgi:hypothetical protein